MVDDESCCSREVETDQTQPRDPKLHIYDKVSRRLRNREDAGLPGFDDELWAHFSRLPARYARAIDLQRAEDVVMHKCLLHRAAGSANGLAFHVRLLQVPQEHDSQERSGQNCSANLRFGRHIHEITFAAYNKPNLLSQLTCLVSELDLNIQEAHAFNTNDGCALDVFVVDGWPYEESERLRYAIHKGVHKSANEVWRKSHMLLPAMQDEEMRDEPALDRVQIPTDGTDEWEVNIKLLQFGTKLASASYGNLYRGMYCNQDVTIKVLNPENISTEMKREFAQEVYIMRKVRHKNVVQFIGACTRAPNLWIVTESMPGGSLHNFIHKQKCILKLPNLLKVALDISKGMNYLHLCNIIHRDLKSANLLMDENKVVKVADFGVARVKSQSGVMTSETGTYRWMAPEVIEHRPYNQKADIFSFGIVLWELLTAKMPYEKMTPLQVALGVVQKGLRPSIPAGTHSKLAALIERCWHQDPHLRPDFSEVSDILQLIAREVGDEKLGRGFWRLSSGATNASLHPAAMFSACRMAQ